MNFNQQNVDYEKQRRMLKIALFVLHWQVCYGGLQHDRGSEEVPSHAEDLWQDLHQLPGNCQET